LLAGSFALFVAPPTGALGAQPGERVSTTYSYVGEVESFEVPEGVGSIGVSALGANGGYGGIYASPFGTPPSAVPAADATVAPPGTPEGSFAPGGSGGEAAASVPVSAGETLSVNVGGAGASSNSPISPYRGDGGVRRPDLAQLTPQLTFGAAGGYGGGGEGGGSEYPYRPERTALFFGGGGGGASSVSNSSTPLLVAGGGGGGGANGGGRNGDDAVQVQPDTLYEQTGNGGGFLADVIPNLNSGDLAIASVNWVAYQPNDMPATPEGWTLLDSASYGEVGELGNAYGSGPSGVSDAYIATYAKLISTAGAENLLLDFPHRSDIYTTLGFGVSNVDPNDPITSHELVIDASRSGSESFPATPVARDHSVVLSITSFPADLPSSVACPVASLSPSALDSGTFGLLDRCSAPPPYAVSYAEEVPSGTFPAVAASWPGYTNALAGEEIVLQPPPGSGGQTGPLPSSGGGGGGSNAQLGAAQAGAPGTIDTSEGERGPGGAGGSESTPGLTEIGEPGQSDDADDDSLKAGGFTGGGGGGGYNDGLGGDFAMCNFEPCAIRGAGGGGGGSDYAVPGATDVRFARAVNASASGNGQLTISYYTAYPSETKAGAKSPTNANESMLTLESRVTAGGSCSGTIQFQIDGSDVGSPATVSGNSAEISVAPPPSGIHHVSAIYSGELSTASAAGCLPSTSTPVAFTVSYPSSTQADPNPSTAVVGEAVTITATVTSSVTDISCQGTVQFELNGNSIGGPVTVQDGTAQISITAPAAGEHQIGATYSGSHGSATEAGCLTSRSTPTTLTTTLTTTAALVATVTPPLTQAEGLVHVKDTACASLRSFTIHLLVPRKQKLISARIYLDGKLLERLGGGRRSYRLDLDGRPYSTATVTIVAIEADGKRISGKRVYHTCRPHKLPGHKHFKI